MARFMTTAQWNSSLRVALQLIIDLPDAWATCNSLELRSCCSNLAESSLCSTCKSHRPYIKKVAAPQVMVCGLSQNMAAAADMSLQDWRQLVLKDQVRH
jgi:hypothetical protein